MAVVDAPVREDQLQSSDDRGSSPCVQRVREVLLEVAVDPRGGADHHEARDHVALSQRLTLVVDHGYAEMPLDGCRATRGGGPRAYHIPQGRRYADYLRTAIIMPHPREELPRSGDAGSMAEAQHQHGKPAEGMECMATMDDITEEDGNYCEYETAPSGTWHPALFAADVVQQLIDTQFHTYMKKVQEADCKAELRRLVAKGPPVWLEDKHALPVPEGDTHVVKVWFAKSNEEKSAKLDGAIEGDARDKLWAELKQLLEAMEEDKEEMR